MIQINKIINEKETVQFISWKYKGGIIRDSYKQFYTKKQNHPEELINSQKHATINTNPES